MASIGRRSEEGAESSYDRDPSSHQYNYQNQHQRRRQQQQQYHNQGGNHYNQPNNSYPHEQLQHGQLQTQQHLPVPPPYHQNGHGNGNGNAIDNTNGNYNNNNTNSNTVPVPVPVPVPPRMRMRQWSDMTRTIWHYERIEQIGEGTYGQVYRARCKDTNEIVAMKKIRVHHGAHWGMPPTVIREIKILKRLVHPNLVRMIEVVSSKGVEHLDADDYHKGSDRSRKNKNKHKSGDGHGGADKSGNDNNNSTKNDNSNNNSNSKQIDVSDAREGYKGNLFLVLEYVPHDLTGLLDVAYKFSEVEIKCVFRQLLEALRYMHDHKYVHRDIKSSNILIDRNFRLKLADFGLARSIEPPLLDNLHDRGSSQEFTNKVITLWYRPPELLLGATRYGFAVDIWSAGCILAELVLGRPLFTGKTEMDQLQLIFDMVGTPNSKSWPGVRDLKLLRTGDVTIDGDSNRKRPKLRERYQSKMNNNAPGAINLVEKLLELDPSKRLTASRALNHRYFLQEPRAPDQPETLGEMKLAEGGSFHEFQTKKKRREAKAEAEKIKQAALDGGHTMKQAQEEYDACYRGIMEKVAQEGLVSTVVANNSATNAANKNGNDKNRLQKAVEGENREKREEKNVAAVNERDQDGHEDRKHRSSKSDGSLERRTTTSRSSRGNDYRDSSSRGRERRSRERSGGGRQDNESERFGGDKNDHEKIRDGSSNVAASTSKEAGSSHRDRDHSKERSRASRASESDDRRKKRRRDSSGEDMERSTHSRRDKDKERHREHQKAPKVEIGVNEINSKSENQSEKIHSTSERTKEEKIPNEDVATDDKSLNKQSVQKNESSKRKDSIDTGNSGKTKESKPETSQSLRDKHEEGPLRDGPTGIDRPDERKKSKPDQEKQPDNEQHHPRSTSSRGDKKRSDRSRDRSRDDDERKDRRDRDHHRRRSSKDRDGRSRDGDRSSSGRISSSKRRKSRPRSPQRDGSPGRNQDDPHRRDREHSRRERDRELRPNHDDNIRDMDRRSRSDRHHHHDDWGPGMMGGRGHLAAMQRRGGDFGGGNHPNNADFGGSQQQHRHDQHHPRGGNNSGPYGSGGGERGPPSRGGDGRGGGPGDFHGPPGRHPSDGNNRGPPHQHPHGGRHPPPMDYYPPGGDHPPPGIRDRGRRPRRDRDRR